MSEPDNTADRCAPADFFVILKYYEYKTNDYRVSKRVGILF